MKESKHTPGPWKVVATPTLKTSMFCICTENSAPEQAIIATVDNTSKLYGFQPDFPAGNAELIASAPALIKHRDKLLSALKAISGIAHNVPCMTSDQQKSFESHAKAEAYRVELNKLIISIRNQARATLAQVESEGV